MNQLVFEVSFDVTSDSGGETKGLGHES